VLSCVARNSGAFDQSPRSSRPPTPSRPHKGGGGANAIDRRGAANPKTPTRLHPNEESSERSAIYETSDSTHQGGAETRG
jgi:hypothetical protein